VEFAAFYAKRAAASLWKSRFDFGARNANHTGGHVRRISAVCTSGSL